MSGFELFVDEVNGRLHAAIVKKTGLYDLYTDPLNRVAAWGAIHCGRITKIDKKLDAAIVDLGNGQSGILPAKHVHLPGGDASESRSGIADLVKNGQMLMVQVKAEAKRTSEHEHQKLPRLTTQIYVMGHHLVYCPHANPVTMSRNIERKDVLGMTAKLKAPGGWILKHHAGEEDLDVLKAEAAKLLAEWQVLLGVKSESGNSPATLKGGPNALYRALYDYGSNSFDHIHIGNKKLFSMMTEWCAKYSPPLATSKRLRLFKPEKPQQRLFDIHDIFGALEELEETRVDLPCGGSLLFDATHALVVVDVNQGSATDPIIANNEAAAETARQIRLRNLSGAILVDFISLPERTTRARLSDLVDDLINSDYSGAQAHGFTRLGIMEITRKRRTGWYSEKLKS